MALAFVYKEAAGKFGNRNIFHSFTSKKQLSYS